LTNNQFFNKKINMKYKDKTKEQLINELAELHQRIEDLEAEATKRKKAEEALRKAYDEMDLRVKERTEDLVEANQQLLREIEERKKAEELLRETLKEIKQLKNQLREENLYLREEINLIHSHKDIVGNSEAISTVLKQIEQVAQTDSTVLIQGETGTGKELLAHAIHDLSSRKGRLMIKINCAALPPTLIESELFGREKGAFTGALSKQSGRFELADASTIFLDEIDALPMELQAKLLRILESGEFERLGSPRTVKVDVRIISATNRDLARLVSESGFREDLYYRLNVFQITVPPLRERREDILPLVWSFVQEFSKRMGKRIESIPQKGVKALQAYPWPGNVRELRNIIERAMIITTGPVLHADVPKIAQSGADQSGTLEEVEKRHIIEALNTTGWRVSGKDGAAEILGINPKTLESKMQRLGIQRKKRNA
jgi:transcriptional regulator with GAF, ATPase, and Fis domain